MSPAPAAQSAPPAASATGSLLGAHAPGPRFPPGSASPRQLAHARWALMFGNFALGCGLMVVAATLTDLSESLQVSVAVAGQLITIAAGMLCFAAPLLAGLLAHWDRRKLLVFALVWYGVGHLVCALMPSYETLWPIRTLTIFGAAVFSPQAGATMNYLAPPGQRARSMAFIFLGWSIASIAGLPIGQWIGATWGWRSAFAFAAAMSLIVAAWVWIVLPKGIRPATMTASAWRGVLTNPVLMAVIAVTGMQAAAQFTIYSYITPYYRIELGATPAQASWLLMWFGALALIGNMLLIGVLDRVGPARAASISLALMACGMLLWPLGTTVMAMALAFLPWGLAAFACNSAQQARLGQIAPVLAPALLALNTSAIYLGQAAGAAGGGWLIAHIGYGSLHWVSAAWALIGVAISVWATRRPVVIPGSPPPPAR